MRLTTPTLLTLTLVLSTTALPTTITKKWKVLTPWDTSRHWTRDTTDAAPIGCGYVAPSSTNLEVLPPLNPHMQCQLFGDHDRSKVTLEDGTVLPNAKDYKYTFVKIIDEGKCRCRFHKNEGCTDEPFVPQLHSDKDGHKVGDLEDGIKYWSCE